MIDRTSLLALTLAAALLGACTAEEADPAPPTTSSLELGAGDGCYPNPCTRGLRDEGVCSCASIVTACRSFYAEGYETTCPALQSWASSCLGGAK